MLIKKIVCETDAANTEALRKHSQGGEHYHV